MSLDHLERVARAAGYATALDEDDAPFVDARDDVKPSAAVRFKTPDAPAPRQASTALARTDATRPGSARVIVTSYVGHAVRGLQSLIGTRGAHA
jgi:hypothetical protein